MATRIGYKITVKTRTTSDNVLTIPLILRIVSLTRMNNRHALKKRFGKATETTYLVPILLPSIAANDENPKNVHRKANNGAVGIAAWNS